MTTFVSIPDTLAAIREQLISEYKNDSVIYNRLENKYFNADTPREWCKTAHPELRRMDKDLRDRLEAINNLEMALSTLSKGEYDYHFDGNF